MNAVRYGTLVVALSGCGDDGAPRPDARMTRPLAIAAVEDLGLLPLPSAVAVGRDGGQSGTLGGKILWTFGDTFLTARNSVDNSNVLSATSGWSTVADPLALVEPVDGGGFPAQLIPYTQVELDANLASPTNGWGLWPGIMVDTGGGNGVIVFQRIKRTNGTGYDSKGVATARITVDATVATRGSGDLFAPPERLFMPQFVHEGLVYAWACESVGFLNNGCRIARAPVASTDVRAAYEFYDGSEWQPDSAIAQVVIEQVGGAPSVSWNPHLGQFLAVSEQILSSTVTLRTADRIEGPWSGPVKIEPSATGILAPTAADSFNYITLEHPELRSEDGSTIVISYSRPTAPFRGDVRLARITLQ